MSLQKPFTFSARKIFFVQWLSPNECDPTKTPHGSLFQPTVYLKAKEIICLENQINGSCSYSRARKIAKIDVNKTRVIHNFMLKVGLIKAS